MNLTKKASVLTALVLAGSLLFTGCGGSETPAPAAPAANSEESTPVEETTAPEPPADPTADFTPNQKAAFDKAELYLSTQPFSKQGLVDQLVFENFAAEDAQIAVDVLDVDWNANAAEKAAIYLSTTGFSYQGLVDQLIFEKYTPEEAAFGATSVGLTP